MQTLIDGAVIVQGNLEATGRLNSRPGVIPVPVKDVWLLGNPFEPLKNNYVHDANHDTWTGSFGLPVTNQTIPAAPTTKGFGGPVGGYALDPSPDRYIPGAN